MLGHPPGNASAGVLCSGPKVLCAQPPLPSCQVSGFRTVLLMVVVVRGQRLWVILCQSFLVRRLVPETLREAPSSHPAHRLGLSHLQRTGNRGWGLGPGEEPRWGGCSLPFLQPEASRGEDRESAVLPLGEWQLCPGLPVCPLEFTV